MKPRMIGAVALFSAASLFGGGAAATMATAASAAPQVGAAAPHTGSITSSSPIPCTLGGVAGTCDLAVTSVTLVDGVLNAVGTVTGTVAGAPVTVPFQAPLQATAGSCPVLDLTLGPLHLDLLGLVVDLNQVHLTIVAQPGPGNLLGNLLCAVTHLLDNTGAGGNAVQNLINLINGILANL